MLNLKTLRCTCLGIILSSIAFLGGCNISITDGSTKVEEATNINGQNSQNEGVQQLPLEWKAPEGLAEGSELIILTDGTYHFGALGPTMLYRQTLANEEPGRPMSMTVPAGRASIQANLYGMPLVETVPELPNGKGLVIGRLEEGRSAYRQAMILDTQTHTEFYEHYYLYWPAEHQDNSLDTLLQATSGWQIKGIWHFLSGHGYGDDTKTDLFAGSPGWIPHAGTFSGGYKIASNSSPLSTFDRTASGITDPDNMRRWRSTPMIRQLWVRSSPTIGSTVGSDGAYRLIDTLDGLIESADYEDQAKWTDDGADEIGFDRFTLPGYMKGFYVDQNQHAYFSDIYQAVGPGAVARVEITDNANYSDSTRVSPCDVTSWSDSEVRVTLRKGIFYRQSLNGLHLHLHDSENQSIYIGQLSSE